MPVFVENSTNFPEALEANIDDEPESPSELEGLHLRAVVGYF